MATWIKVHREILQSQSFSNPITFKIWMWLLLKANWTDNFVSLKNGKGYIDLKVSRGQMIFGRNKAEEELQIDGATIARHVKKLEEMGNISQKVSNQYSLITICNYESYQLEKNESEQRIDTRIDTRIDAGMSTPKNNKKNKKNKEIIIDYFFKSEEYKKAYDKWVCFRKEKKKDLSETMIEAQQNFLSNYTEETAIKIIETSIMNGWQGLFPPKDQPKQSNYQPSISAEENTW